MKGLLRNIFSKISTKIDSIKDGVKKLNKKFDGFFDFSWTLGSLFAKVAFVVQGIFTLIFGFASLIFAIFNFKSIVDIIKGTVKGSSFWLEKLQNIVSGYPSFQTLVQNMDLQLSSMGTFFSPPLTFSRILSVTGIGDAVNAIIICAVQGLGFVISMRLLFWSLARVKLTMIKPIK